MFLADYHMHTNYSIDSNVSIRDRVQWAINNNIQEICLTDHLEPLSEDDIILFNIDTSIETTPPDKYRVHNYEQYKKEIQQAQAEFGDKIKIKFGAELGLMPELYEDGKRIIASNDFDFVIGSTHQVGDTRLFPNCPFYDNKTKIQAFNEYLESIYNNTKNITCYDIYGHIDYVYRYSHYENNKLDYNEHKELIDAILKNLVEQGKGLEVNLSGVRYGHNSFHPSLPILKAFKSLGGEIVTVGSDTHNLQEVNPLIIQAQEVLKEAGFKYLATFDKRKPNFVKF